MFSITRPFSYNQTFTHCQNVLLYIPSVQKTGIGDLFIFYVHLEPSDGKFCDLDFQKGLLQLTS